MAQTAEQYFKALFAEAGIDDTSTAAVLTHFANPKIAERVNGVLKTAQDDYQAQVGRVRAAEQRVQQYDNWYGTESKKYNDMVAELATAKAALNGGGGNGYQEPPQFDASKYLTKEDLQKFAVDQSTRTASVIKSVGKLASRHAAKFGEELDVDALEEIATKNNLPLEAAYAQYIAPREETKRNEDFEKRLKAAKDEGAKEALSRHRLPVDAVPQESAPINRYAKTGADRSGIASDAELMEVWNSAAGGGQK